MEDSGTRFLRWTQLQRNIPQYTVPSPSLLPTLLFTRSARNVETKIKLIRVGSLLGIFDGSGNRTRVRPESRQHGIVGAAVKSGLHAGLLRTLAVPADRRFGFRSTVPAAVSGHRQSA